MDFENLNSLDFVELGMAAEEAFPDFELQNDTRPEDIIQFIRHRLGDEPGGEIGALIQRKGPSSRGGATATPAD